MSISTVFIDRLPYGLYRRDLEQIFKRFGRLRGILLKRGFAFVGFEDSRDARDAVRELNGKELMGNIVIVELAKNVKQIFGKSEPTKYRLIVENLASSVSWKDLKNYMGTAGDVTYCDAHNMRRNEAIVEFASSSDMRHAIEKLDNTELGGRRIRLIEDRRSGRGGREGRSRSRGSRSVSRRRSRSKSTHSSRSRNRSKSRSKSKSPLKSRSGSCSRTEKSRERSELRSRSPSSKRSPPKSRNQSRLCSPSKPSGDFGNRDRARFKSHSSSRSASREHRDESCHRSISRSRSISSGTGKDSCNRNKSIEY